MKDQIEKRNPYINYNDNSIPNIVDMTQSSQKLKRTEMNSSLEIYDQDIFSNELSVTQSMQQSDPGNQQHYQKLLT